MPLTDYYNQLRLTGNQGMQIPTQLSPNRGISPNNNTSAEFDPAGVNATILGYHVFSGEHYGPDIGTGKSIGRNDPRYADFLSILNPATLQEERQRLIGKYSSQSSPTTPNANPNPNVNTNPAANPNMTQSTNSLQNQYNPGQNRNMSGLVSHYRVTRGY